MAFFAVGFVDSSPESSSSLEREKSGFRVMEGRKEEEEKGKEEVERKGGRRERSSHKIHIRRPQ